MSTSSLKAARQKGSSQTSLFDDYLKNEPLSMNISKHGDEYMMELLNFTQYNCFCRTLCFFYVLKNWLFHHRFGKKVSIRM